MKAPRLKVIGGITVKTTTGCGPMYIQMNWQNGKIFEVFATLGKTGGCATCQSEGITRSVTLGLRSGVPVDEYIRQLRGIKCPNPHPFPKEEAVDSCPDAVSKVLEQYGRMSVDEVMKIIVEANKVEAEVDEEKVAMAEMEKERKERRRQGI